MVRPRLSRALTFVAAKPKALPILAACSSATYPILLAAALLLIKAAESWRQTHDGKMPTTSKERSEFKQLLSSWQHHIEGVPLEVQLLRPRVHRRHMHARKRIHFSAQA